MKKEKYVVIQPVSGDEMGSNNLVTNIDNELDDDTDVKYYSTNAVEENKTSSRN
jgi:hypothetical protein